MLALNQADNEVGDVKIAGVMFLGAGGVRALHGGRDVVTLGRLRGVW